MKKRLGEILLERGLIDVDQLNAALAHQRQWGMRLGTALVAKGFIAEGVLTRVLSESLSIPMVDLARLAVEPKALQIVPRRLAEQYDVFPIALREQPNGRRVLLLAMADPLNATAVDEIAFTTDTIVKPAIAQISSLEQAIKKHYYGARLDIAPLALDRTTMPPIHSDEPMTIVGGHGEERVVDTTGSNAIKPVLQLTDEVTDRTAVAELRREFARRDLSVPPTLTTPPIEYQGHPTGVFSMPMGSGESMPVAQDDVLSIRPAADVEAVEALEKKFWALMRILAKRGLVTKEEFLTELRQGE